MLNRSRANGGAASAKALGESPRPSAVSAKRTWLILVILLVATHLALLAGITTPDKFVFDEVHYVPAARQMLEPVMPEPMLNPMHPPLAKQLIALSIRIFGDNPLGWRYPGTLFGALAVVGIYLCGLVLFGAQAPALAAALLAFFNQMLFVTARTAMLDIFALGFSLLGIAAFLKGFGEQRPQRWFALAGAAFGLSAACKWSGLFPLAVAVVIVAGTRLLQGWRTRFADAGETDWYRPDRWPDVAPARFAVCFALLPAVVYLLPFIVLHGPSPSALIEAQRRIFADNTTSTLGTHIYASSWPSWPLLVRPVWFLFDKTGEDTVEAVVLLGNPLLLWSALLAVVIALRDFIVARRADAFLVVAFYAGCYLAWALLPRTLGFLYYYLPSATLGSLALVYALRRNGRPRWLLWAFVAIAGAAFVAMLPVSAAFVGTSMTTFNRLMIFQSWI